MVVPLSDESDRFVWSLIKTGVITVKSGWAFGFTRIFGSGCSGFTKIGFLDLTPEIGSKKLRPDIPGTRRFGFGSGFSRFSPNRSRAAKFSSLRCGDGRASAAGCRWPAGNEQRGGGAAPVRARKGAGAGHALLPRKAASAALGPVLSRNATGAVLHLAG
jgi:hypothetical protein